MIEVSKNLIILDSLSDIITKLRSDAYERFQRTYFSSIKVRPDGGVQVSCPYHKHGLERKASSGIQNGTGMFHCFTCGVVATLPQLIEDVLEESQGFGEKWLKKNCNSAAVQIRDLGGFPGRSKLKQLDYISEKELDSYRYIHPYMYQRHLTDDVIERYDIGYDPNFQLVKDGNRIPCITFPVRDKNGNTLFIGRRSIKGKMFHYPSGVEKPIYGIYELYRDNKIGVIDGNYHTIPKIIVAESFLNTLNCVANNIPSVAMIGTGSKTQYQFFDRLPVDEIWLGFDPDPAGDKAVLRFLNNVKRSGVKVLDLPEGKDLNDLTPEELHKLSPLSIDEWKTKYGY